MNKVGFCMDRSGRIADNHISVDCVVFGFDGEKMCCLLVRRAGEENGEVFHDMKLPGSLINMDEDLDDAARRVLLELTGLKTVRLSQFRAYGSKDRTKNPKDVHWLERAEKMKIDRIVTIAYIAMIKIDRAISMDMDELKACWMPLDEIPALAFDHNQIISDAVSYMRIYSRMNPSCMFDLLPRRFTAAQLRKLYCMITGNEIDARNFYKKLAAMPYVIPSEEKETGVAHRAGRLFKFDRSIYKKTRI